VDTSEPRKWVPNIAKQIYNYFNIHTTAGTEDCVRGPDADKDILLGRSSNFVAKPTSGEIDNGDGEKAAGAHSYTYQKTINNLN